MTNAADGRRDFFISFNQADRAWATWVAWVLEEAGYSVWFQHWDFQGNFVYDMDRAHDESHRTIGILSPNALASDNVQAEWNARRAEDPQNKFDRLVLVRVYVCDPPGLLRSFVWLDLVNCDQKSAIERLIARLSGIRRKPEDPPIFPGEMRHEVVTQEPLFPLPHNLPQPNRAFVGRTAELEALSKALAGTGRAEITQPQTITGLGGIGKTQLALSYAYAHLTDYDLIRWLRAEEGSTLAADYTGLAPALGLNPATPDQPALVAAIRAMLENMARWLLVFDNATEPAMLDNYLPRTGAGHLLITSRRTDWQGIAKVLELEVMKEGEALQLLTGRPDPDTLPAAERAEAAALATELGYLPLALAQARAYMAGTGKSLAGYRKLFEASRPAVLGRGRPSPDYPASVAKTWQISINAAADACAAARPLLELLAFFAPDTLPVKVLASAPAMLPEGLGDELERDEAIAALHRFSLLRAEADTLTVHRLVQAVTRDGLDAATAKAHAVAAVQLVKAVLPRPPWEHTNWPAIGALLPHALATTEAAERFEADLETAARVLNAAALYHKARAAYAEAEPLYQRALKIRETVLGPEHPHVATSLNNLAGLYRAQGRYAEAEPLYQRALAIFEKALGPEHPHVAIIRNSLSALAATHPQNGGP